MVPARKTSTTHTSTPTESRNGAVIQHTRPAETILIWRVKRKLLLREMTRRRTQFSCGKSVGGEVRSSAGKFEGESERRSNEGQAGVEGALVTE